MPESERTQLRKPERVQYLDRAFALLERLADAEEPITLSEIAERTELPAATVHRLLGFLTSQGYVQQVTAKRYRLGLRMIRLGRAAGRGLGTYAEPCLNQVVELFGETANIAMLESDLCVYVAQVPSPRTVRMFTEVGQMVTPHCTGVGKAILSLMPDDEVVALLHRVGMAARTEHTLTTPEALLADLAQVRKRGYATDDGEQELGVMCVAVPLLDLPFLAALSVSGPSSRLGSEQVPTMAARLTQIAAEFSAKFPGPDQTSELAG